MKVFVFWLIHTIHTHLLRRRHLTVELSLFGVVDVWSGITDATQLSGDVDYRRQLSLVIIQDAAKK